MKNNNWIEIQDIMYNFDIYKRFYIEDNKMVLEENFAIVEEDKKVDGNFIFQSLKNTDYYTRICFDNEEEAQAEYDRIKKQLIGE